jgi:hypothetical protein
MPNRGVVYIVWGRGTQYVKIGRTGQLFQRLPQVQRNVPFPLEVLFVEEVNYMGYVEDALHARYSAYRVNRASPGLPSDWYVFPEEILADLRAQRALPGSLYSRVRALFTK